MEFLTNDKLTIVGAAGMIGSNMAQTYVCTTLMLPDWKVWPKSCSTADSKE